MCGKSCVQSLVEENSYHEDCALQFMGTVLVCCYSPSSSIFNTVSFLGFCLWLWRLASRATYVHLASRLCPNQQALCLWVGPLAVLLSLVLCTKFISTRKPYPNHWPKLLLKSKIYTRTTVEFYPYEFELPRRRTLHFTRCFLLAHNHIWNYLSCGEFDYGTFNGF